MKIQNDSVPTNANGKERKTITVPQELAIRVMSELDNNTSLLWELMRDQESHVVTHVCSELYYSAENVSIEFCKLLPEGAQAQFYPDKETRDTVMEGEHG